MTADGGADDGGGGDGGGGDGGSGTGGELGGLLSRLAESMGPGGLELGGENVRFEREPEHGLEVRITLLDTDGVATSVASMFVPGDEPPAAYPEDLPFVRGAALRVIRDYGRDMLLAMWMLDPVDAPDPDVVLKAVVRGSREARWRLEDEASGEVDEGGVRLRRGGRVRKVGAKVGGAGPVVALSERRG